MSKRLLLKTYDHELQCWKIFRPSTKRKRKFKRMALDPDNSVNDPQVLVTKSKTGTIKRKKVRSKSACESAPKSSRNVTLKSPKRQRQVSTANVVPGKRKRSSREKSVEPDLILSQSTAPSHSMITEEVIENLMTQVRLSDIIWSFDFLPTFDFFFFRAESILRMLFKKKLRGFFRQTATFQFSNFFFFHFAIYCKKSRKKFSSNWNVTSFQKSTLTISRKKWSISFWRVK